MRAVFMCTEGAYRQVGYWDVNAVTPVFGKSYSGEELAVHRASHIVGYTVNYPLTEPEMGRIYLFSEGKDHNQLTLTDAKEIYNMRKWIQSRGSNNTDFVELSCDEEAEHITEAYFMEPVAVPKEPVRAREPQEEPTEWDLKYSSMLRRR